MKSYADFADTERIYESLFDECKKKYKDNAEINDLKDFIIDLKNQGNGLDLSDFTDINDIYEAQIPYDEIEAYNKFYKCNLLYEDKKEKENMNELELLDKVTDAATFLYVKNMGDNVAPNILVSKLPNKQCYVSLNRYITPGDRFQKTIMFKTTKRSSREALMDVAKFLAKQKIVKTTNPLEELEMLIDEDDLDMKNSITPGIHNW